MPMLPHQTVAQIKDYLVSLQKKIIDDLLLEDQDADCLKDAWKHHSGGGGLTCLLNNSQIFEKAGVNFSHVYGQHLPDSATIGRDDLKNQAFQALGISLVIHPHNPYVPTTHANIRFFTTDTPNPVWWFGGGFDLTPYYGFKEDCKHWHRTAKQACDPFGDDVYKRYKQWCDHYFYLPHRQEPRGIGGLFFDDLHKGGFEKCFAFMRSVGDHFSPAYLPIVQKRKNHPYGEREKHFQKIRRGRYVEFNLLYDRGTLFGLQSKGRTESILMSLPPTVNWEYSWQAEANSPEANLLKEFLIAKDW